MVYETPTLEVIQYDSTDVITSSTGLDGEWSGDGDGVNGGWDS